MLLLLSRRCIQLFANLWTVDRQDLSPGGILWKAGAPKKTSLVKEKGSMYVCYECFYECICDVHMCTQGHGLMCKGVCVCVCEAN